MLDLCTETDQNVQNTQKYRINLGFRRMHNGATGSVSWQQTSYLARSAP